MGNLGSSVILTGGRDRYTLTTVSQYNEAGWEKDLPTLQTGRWGHGCAYFNNDAGSKTMLVTGGTPGSGYLTSTELLVGTAPAWVFTGELPSPRYAPQGTTIDNMVLMTGGIETVV